MSTTAEIEALEADETEEELNTDELEAALEASRTSYEVKDGDDDTTGEDVSEEVDEGEPPKDPGAATPEGAEEVPEEKVVEKPPEEDSLAQENRELRQLLREQKKELATMAAKVSRIEQGMVDDLDEDGEPPKLSRIEELQHKINAIGQQKGAIFEVLVEAMEANPKYADVQSVCTRENFDDLFEELGRAIASERGGSPLERQLEVEAEVWAMPNPYKYMYGIIKRYHPRYAEPEEKTPPKEKEVPAKTKKVVPAKAPTSIASVGGGDQDTKSGWTAKRIDDLPEDELDKVPKEIYAKYLRGEID